MTLGSQFCAGLIAGHFCIIYATFSEDPMRLFRQIAAM
jgi:hypothetical protein